VVLEGAYTLESRRNQPLESIHGSEVGPDAWLSLPGRQSWEFNPWEATPGHTLPLATSTGDEEFQGKCGLAARGRIGRPALGTSPSMMTAANPAARALARPPPCWLRLPPAPQRKVRRSCLEPAEAPKLSAVRIAGSPAPNSRPGS